MEHNQNLPQLHHPVYMVCMLNWAVFLEVQSLVAPGLLRHKTGTVCSSSVKNTIYANFLETFFTSSKSFFIPKTNFKDKLDLKELGERNERNLF